MISPLFASTGAETEVWGATAEAETPATNFRTVRRSILQSIEIALSRFMVSSLRQVTGLRAAYRPISRYPSATRHGSATERLSDGARGPTGLCALRAHHTRLIKTGDYQARSFTALEAAM